MTDQERWQLVTNIIDQMEQEVKRLREGKTLSNAAGIRRMIKMLAEDVGSTEAGSRG